jgi:symplekin
MISQRGDPLEISLSIVPPDHKLIPPKSLEAEASGLLDRMLAVFQENVRCVRPYSFCYN